jgi:hypothetical protein
MAPAAIASIVVCLTLLEACSPEERFLLYLDPYEFQLLDSRGIDSHAIRESVPGSVEVMVETAPVSAAPDQALQRFLSEVEELKPEWIYLSPAHPFSAGDAAARVPDSHIFWEDPAGRSSANLIALVYDREQANYEAGRAIAALLEDPVFLQKTGASEAGLRPPRIGILVAAENEKVEREISRFEGGFASLADPARIERKDVGSLSDRVKARRLLDAMKEEGVAIFVLKTYSLSSFCLEHLAKEGGLAVVEEPILGQAYRDTVLLMLADDFLGAVERMAAYAENGSSGSVIAPVRLLWNESYRPPGILPEEGEGRP